MTLVDTSAWVEYLRATGSATHHRLRSLIDEAAPLHTTEIVYMEVLAGGRDVVHVAQLRRLLGRCTFVPIAGLGDFESAAELYRRCRWAGETIRALTDCLVAAVALRADLDVLALDSDFDALARQTGLRLRR